MMYDILERLQSRPRQNVPDAEQVAVIIRDYIDANHAECIEQKDYHVIDLRAGERRFRIIALSRAEENRPVRLSPRERQIAVLIADGYPNKHIAYELKISPNTVKTYLQRIFTKLQVKTRTEMIAQMMKSGLMQDL